MREVHLVRGERAVERGFLAQMMDMEFADPAAEEKYLGIRAQMEDQLSGAC